MGVKAQIPHTTVFAVECNLPFPVDGFLQVHVIAVMKTTPNLHEPAVTSLLDPLNKLFCPGIVGKLRAAFDDELRMFGCGAGDFPVSLGVDPKWLLTE